jgi:hypothetical protein
MNTQTTITQNGNFGTRGDYGSPVRILHAVVWDNECGGWREASEEEVSGAVWGAWDADYGWMAPWTPSDPPVAAKIGGQE